MYLNEVIDNYVIGIGSFIANFFASYGWSIVFVLIAMYFSWPYVNILMKKRSLAQANNPARKKILDEERKRVRMYQQLDVYKASKEASKI